MDLIDCKSDDEVSEVGTAWAIQQARELKEFGVPVIHFYTMGRYKAVRKVAENVF